jgi:hypothetical protein
MGTIDIEWDDIVSATSDFEYEVEIQSGRVYYGKLAPGEEGSLQVVGSQATYEVAQDRVVRIRAIRQRFWARIDGSLGLGFSYTQSSQVTQLNMDFNTTYQTRKFAHTLQANTVITTTGGESEDETKRASVAFFHNRYLKKRNFVQGFAALQQNEELGLDLRFLLGGTFGHHVVQTHQSRLSLSAGLDLNVEEPTGDEPSRESLEVATALQYNIYKWDDPKRILSLTLFAFPSLTISGRVRSEFNTSYTQGITGDLDLVITLFQSADTDPPTANAETTDWGITTSVSWNF